MNIRVYFYFIWLIYKIESINFIVIIYLISKSREQKIEEKDPKGKDK